MSTDELNSFIRTQFTFVVVRRFVNIHDAIPTTTCERSVLREQVTAFTWGQVMVQLRGELDKARLPDAPRRIGRRSACKI